MSPTVTVRTMLAIVLASCAIGAIDAGRANAWDLVGIFGLVAALSTALLVRTTGRRPLVPVRSDLQRWLAARAATTGERIEDLTDRALSAYRAGIVGDGDATGEGSDSSVDP